MKENIIVQVLEELTSEGINNVKPVALVGKINTKVQARNPKESELTATIQEIYIRIQEQKGWDRNKARQSWVTASGGDFEGFVRNHMSRRAARGSYLSALLITLFHKTIYE